MKAIKLSRKIHKWFALVLGIQLFLWALSGFYMVVVDIDIIHGDMLVKNTPQSVQPDARFAVPLEQLATDFPNAERITLKSMMNRPVYEITGATTVLLSALDGRQISPLDEATAIEVARYHYAGDADIQSVRLIERDPPTELQARALPLWRVDFDDAWNSSFYIDPNSGDFTTRRHTLWRIFDFVWMLHIMDYDERADFNNVLLRIFSVLGTVFGLSGVWLMFYSFNRKRALEQTQ